MIRRLLVLTDQTRETGRRLAVVAFGLLIAVVVSGCGGRAQSSPGRVILALADVSDSTVGNRRQFYTDFEQLLGALRPGDVLLVDRITENPTSTFPIRVEANEYNALTDNRLLFGRRERQDRKKTMDRLYELLFKRRSITKGTRILASLRLVEGAFKAHGDRQPVLVIFSDMIEQSNDYDFAGQDLSAEGVQYIIAQERSRGRLPDLKGVRVYVAGALGTGALDADRAFAIRDFWLAYFKACGADLPKERYAATLLAFSSK